MNPLVLLTVAIIIIAAFLAVITYGSNSPEKPMRTCPAVFKLNGDYIGMPSAIASADRTKTLMTPYISQSAHVGRLNGGYYLYDAYACTKQDALSRELSNPDNIIFFDMSYKEYENTKDSKYLFSKLIDHPFFEFYICDREAGGSFSADLNATITEGRLSQVCERVI